MTIAGYAIGAEQGILYLRAEYDYPRRHLEAALNRRREKGLLGKLGDGFAFDIRIQMGAGADRLTPTPEKMRRLFRAAPKAALLSIRGYDFGHFCERLSPKAGQNLEQALRFLRQHLQSVLASKTTTDRTGRLRGKTHG